MISQAIAANRQRLSRQNVDAIALQREPNPVVKIGETRADIQLSKGELTDGGTTYGVKIFNTKSEGQIVSVIRPSGSQIGTFDELSTQAIRRKEKLKPKKNKGKKFTTLFWCFLTISYSSGSFTVTGSDYEQYNDFVANGFTIRKSEELTKTDGISTIEVRILFDKSIEITFKAVGASVPFSDPPSVNITGTVECWRKKPKQDGKITASRETIYANFVPSGFESDFTLVAGNPGDRTQTASLQANGYYKTAFNLISTSFRNVNSSYYFKGIYRAVAVPFAEDINIP
jgi:hypothetical protein